MTNRQFFEQMPKVELHLHLDGAFTLDFLFELVNKYGGDPEILSVKDLEKRFVFKDFPHFIETWFWKNRFFRESVDFEESTYRTLEKMSQQNIIYTEAFISPWDYRESGVAATDIIIANQNAVKRAERDFNIKCRLLVDITRDHGSEHAMDRLDEVSPYVGSEIIGIGLGGSEQNFPAVWFKDVFIEAKARGFHTVAHAGEVVGPESVWSAINDLYAERIGHGVRSVEDTNLVQFLQSEKIPLEVCIVSNIKTGVFPDYQSHPVVDLINKGVLVTINSDDPTMFGSTLANEYSILDDVFNLPMAEMQRIALNAVEASFASETDKQSMKQKIDRFRAENIQLITNNN